MDLAFEILNVKQQMCMYHYITANNPLEILELSNLVQIFSLGWSHVMMFINLLCKDKIVPCYLKECGIARVSEGNKSVKCTTCW